MVFKSHHRRLIIWKGRIEWYLNGVIHREDGPAVIYYDGAKSWYREGKYIEGKYIEVTSRIRSS